MLDLALEESDTETVEETTHQVQTLEGKIHKLSFDLMLDGEDDRSN
jgi:hypothetical protein